MAMERIQTIENVSVDVLFATDVSQILYTYWKVVQKNSKEVPGLVQSLS